MQLTAGIVAKAVQGAASKGRCVVISRQIKDLCTLVVDCPHSTPVWTDSGALVFRSPNIRKGRLDLSERSFTTDEEYGKRVRRAVPSTGDIIITREAPMGEVALIPEGVRGCLGQRMVLLRPDPEKAAARYLLYALMSPMVQEEIGAHEGTGSTVSNLRIPALEGLRIPSPPLADQRAIAHILGTLDDKIELNRRMNETLEAMARALFKSWFVDFDPVRAKAEGRDTGLPKHLSELFPDSFEDSELGETPKGWLVRSLKDILREVVERVGTADLPEYSSTNEGLQLRSERFTKKLSVSNANNKVIRKGCLVFGLSRRVLNFGLMRDEIGSVSPAYKVLAIDTDSISPDLLEQTMRVKPAYFYGAVSASSREGQSISLAGLGGLCFVQPSTAAQEAYYQVIGPLIRRARSAVDESETLTALRDTLLPKLISGELRLRDAEKLVASAN